MWEKIKDIFSSIRACIEFLFMEPTIVLWLVSFVFSPLALIIGGIMFCFNVAMWSTFVITGLGLLALFVLISLWWYFF